VPLGCFSTAMLFVVFVGSIVLIVFSAVKSSDVYKDALALAKTHPAVIEALGSPVTEGLLLSGPVRKEKEQFTIFSNGRLPRVRPDQFS
jgi:Cytochrome oxidase complex assembly protein 1